jgi:hypothetical protein
MILPEWLRRSHHKRPMEADPDLEMEKLSLQRELAQKVVTFDRRRDRVHKLAVVTLHSMREGNKR